ncbi:hypothetical protein [Streptomyces sp. NPDC057301]|uniref:hypothetical protein n=1 Tax=Streptomyces sp. NPDC057301 TaxID=3346093 RepID=UPI0036370B22
MLQQGSARWLTGLFACRLSIAVTARPPTQDRVVHGLRLRFRLLAHEQPTHRPRLTLIPDPLRHLRSRERRQRRIAATAVAHPEGALTVTLEDAQNNRAVFPASASTGEDFVVRVPVTEPPVGTWRGELRFGNWALPLPELHQNLAPAKWRRRALPWYAKPAPGAVESFALQVAKTNLVRAVTRRAKP